MIEEINQIYVYFKNDVLSKKQYFLKTHFCEFSYNLKIK